MAIQTGGLREGEPHSEMNTTPLIDVMLVLLVMLIVALPPQRDAITLDTPQTPKEQARVEPKQPITVRVDFDGVVYWNDEAVSLPEMERRMIAEGGRADQAEVHITPHRLAKYKTVAAVMGAAQRNGIVRMGVLGGT